MSDLFYGYNLKDRGHDVSKILADHIKRFGLPPEICHINKFDCESIVNAGGVTMKVEPWVLSNHLLAEILDNELSHEEE